MPPAQAYCRRGLLLLILQICCSIAKIDMVSILEIYATGDVTMAAVAKGRCESSIRLDLAQAIDF